MDSIMKKLLLIFRKEEFLTAKEYLKYVRIDRIVNNITKDCYINGIQYEVMCKGRDAAIIKLKDDDGSVLLRYYRKERYIARDIERFMLFLRVCGLYRGIYITAADLEDKKEFIKKGKEFDIKLSIVEGSELVANHLGLKNSVFTIKTISFISYLPY